MRPASAAFLRTVRSSHTMTARARAVAPGQSGNDPDGVELEVIGGDVQLDAKADVRGTLDLTTAGDRFPSSSTDPLAPYGQEVFVERGLQYANGSVEWISLGYFRLSDVEQAGAPVGAVRIGAADRMVGLLDARLLAPVQLAASQTLGSVVDQLVSEVFPGAVVVWDDATETRTLGRSVIVEEKRHEFLRDLVTAAGKIWFWDHNGHLQIKSPPDPSEPVEQLSAGSGGVLITLDRSLSRAGTYNAVVAIGEAPDDAPPVRAVAVDNDPASPTYFYGPFGEVPRFFSSELMTTTAQAEAAAVNLLSSSLGLPYNVDLSAVPNPALEPLDPVTVTYPAKPRATAIDYRTETHILEKLTVPLTPEGALEASTREQTATTIGVIT